MLDGVLDGVRTQNQMVRDQQQLVAWENYDHEIFRKVKPSTTHKCKRDSVLAVETQPGWVEVSCISSFSIVTARVYSAANPKLPA